MANHNIPTTQFFSDIDKLMDSVFPTSALFASRKDTPVRWTRKTVTYSNEIYVTAVLDDESEADDDGGLPVVTATKIVTVMDPYSEEPLYPLPTTRLPTTISTKTVVANSSNETSPEPISSAGSDDNASVSPTHHHPHGISEGVIAAIAVGTILTLTVIISMTWICIRQRRRWWNKTDNSTPPQNTISSPYDLSPPRLPELSSHADRTATPEQESSWLTFHDMSDPRETLSQGVRSPTPQPAVAEVRSYTRTWQKPRVYTVGGQRIAELPGSEPTSNATADSRESAFTDFEVQSFVALDWQRTGRRA
ncbi:hypothetical protein FZEAL_3189 [Fusarium zealandicum]|uniref:Uncharacterized protein n=1 Tax=Fusarium zealandicum TaxID=1053134 RepID=A0A8H4UP96_9HYPO|nr:hypothetical protein FZEAL_3189 [Fusarium zealandicum]